MFEVKQTVFPHWIPFERKGPHFAKAVAYGHSRLPFDLISYFGKRLREFDSPCNLPFSPHLRGIIESFGAGNNGFPYNWKLEVGLLC
jgi:hypothetical protein